MSTLETERHAAELEARELSGELPKCPKCGCASLVTTEYWPPTSQDPACATGYCTCRKGEMLSVCCGAPEHPDVPEFCSACNEGTGWERECEAQCTYEFG